MKNDSPEKVLKQVKYLKITDQVLQTTDTGTIYKGINIENNKPMMVKVVSKDRFKIDANFDKIIQNEYFIIRNLKNENLLNFHSMIETDSNFYLASEFSLESNLKDYLDLVKGLKEIKAVNIFLELLNGYSEFFKMNTLHLNITTRNIYLHENKFKLIIFFKSHHPKSQEELKKHFKINGFMSHELLTAQPLDNKSDIWSLGVILFIILFGKYPFIGDSLEELEINVRMVYHLIIENSMKINPISLEMKDLLQKIFQIDPKKRISFPELMSHKLMKKIKEMSEKYLNENYKLICNKIKSEKEKYSDEIFKTASLILEDPSALFKQKNLKIFENFTHEFGDYCKFIRIYTEIEPKYEKSFPKELQSPAKLLKKQATLVEITDKSFGYKKAKSIEDIKFEDEELYKYNSQFSEDETKNLITYKYYNEMDWYGFLNEFVDFLKEFQKEFDPFCIIARFCIIKYIYYRNMHFDFRVEENDNIFCLSYWDKISKSKEYKNIKEIIRQKYLKDGVNVWKKPYIEINIDCTQIIDNLIKKNLWNRPYDQKEKAFMSLEQSLNVILFYHDEFQLIFKRFISEFLKELTRKINVLLKNDKKVPFKFFKLGLYLIRISNIIEEIGLKRFESIKKVMVSELRNFFDELKAEEAENCFMFEAKKYIF